MVVLITVLILRSADQRFLSQPPLDIMPVEMTPGPFLYFLNCPVSLVDFTNPRDLRYSS